MTVELHPWTRVLQSRYTTKAFDPHKRLDESQVASVMALLQWAPSSTNAQPWHFVIAGTPEGRQRVAGAMTGRYAFNQSKVLDASHVVVLASRQHLDEGYLHCLLQNEQAAGRFATDAARQGQHEGRGMFVDMHQKLRQDGPHWHEKANLSGLGLLALRHRSDGHRRLPDGRL